MFQKIQERLGPEMLHPGTTIICYPVEGISVADINLSNVQDFLLYIVTAVRDEIISLQLEDDTIEPAETKKDGKHIIKFFSELIDVGKWWTRLAF